MCKHVHQTCTVPDMFWQDPETAPTSAQCITGGTKEACSAAVIMCNLVSLRALQQHTGTAGTCPLVHCRHSRLTLCLPCALADAQSEEFFGFCSFDQLREILDDFAEKGHAWATEVVLNLDDCEGGCGLQDVDGSFVMPSREDAPVPAWEVRHVLIQLAHLRFV